MRRQLVVAGGLLAAVVLVWVGAVTTRVALWNYRRHRIDAATKDVDPRHPWAGRYFTGDGASVNAGLKITEGGEFFAENWGCFGEHFGVYGHVVVEESIIRLVYSDGSPDRRFRPVDWEDRRYFIEEGDEPAFCAAIVPLMERRWQTDGSEPRGSMEGDFFLRDGDHRYAVFSTPALCLGE